MSCGCGHDAAFILCVDLNMQPAKCPGLLLFVGGHFACTRRGVTNGTLSSERRRAGFVDNTPLKWLPRCRCVEVNSGTWRCAIVSSQGNSTRQLLVGLAHCHHRPFVPVPFLATPKPISIRSAFGPDEGPSFSCGYSESSLRIFFENSRPNLGRRWQMGSLAERP